jgi:hypothetical protein
MTDPHKSELSPGLSGAIVEFCVTHSQPAQPVPAASLRSPMATIGEASATIVYRAATVEERVTCVGPGLVAVRTNPTAGSKAVKALVVMVNAGAVHHIGVNRSYVTLARQLALRGTSALRVDLEGLGDSAVGHEPVAPRLYSTGSLQSLVTTLAELRRERPVVVIGLCAGAYSAYHAALQTHVDGLILINPQTFGFKEGDPIDVPSSRTVYKQAIDVRHHMHDVSAWKRLLRGQVNVARAVRVLAQQSWLRARTQSRRWLTQMGTMPASEVERGLRKLASSGTKVCFVFSKTDPGLSYLDEVLRGRTHLLVSRRVVSLTTIDRADHTFTPHGTQDELLRAITLWLSDAFGV